MLDQSDNLDYCYLILCCYFKSIIVQEIGVLNPCFIFSKSLIDKVRQDNNWDKNYHLIHIWISIWISCSKCSLYFRYYIIFCPSQVKFYFTVNQWKIKRSPKINIVFQWNNKLCVKYIMIVWRASYYFFHTQTIYLLLFCCYLS